MPRGWGKDEDVQVKASAGTEGARRATGVDRG